MKLFSASQSFNAPLCRNLDAPIVSAIFPFLPSPLSSASRSVARSHLAARISTSPQLLAHRFLSKKDGFAISRSQFTIHHFENESAIKSFESSNSASLFDSAVVKISRSGKPMNRVIVLTKTALYRLDPGLSVNPKRCVQAQEIDCHPIFFY